MLHCMVVSNPCVEMFDKWTSRAEECGFDFSYRTWIKHAGWSSEPVFRHVLDETQLWKRVAARQNTTGVAIEWKMKEDEHTVDRRDICSEARQTGCGNSAYRILNG